MGTKLISTSDATLAWNMLNGIFLIYKPLNVSFNKVRKTLIDRLCQDLNSMKTRPPENYVSIEGRTNEKMRVIVRPSYADNVLVVGPRYQYEDIKLSSANIIPSTASGVLICGINDGNRLIQKIRGATITRFYRVAGVLGQATDNYFKTGKIVEKSTYKHIKRSQIDNICAAMQSSHQRKMFELCGVHMQSQAAYELAVKGLIRPTNKEIPMIYSIKCIDFQPPDFTLEIVCINEYITYLMTLIHDLGMQLHSTATCTQIQCFRYGPFNVNHALLSKFWDIENILQNINMCKEICSKNPHILEQESATLAEENIVHDDEPVYSENL